MTLLVNPAGLIALNTLSFLPPPQQDLRTLRQMALYLLHYDAVTFLSFLEGLRASEGKGCLWLFHDAAHVLFEMVSGRWVFRGWCCRLNGCSSCQDPMPPRVQLQPLPVQAGQGVTLCSLACRRPHTEAWAARTAVQAVQGLPSLPSSSLPTVLLPLAKMYLHPTPTSAVLCLVQARRRVYIYKHAPAAAPKGAPGAEGAAAGGAAGVEVAPGKAGGGGGRKRKQPGASGSEQAGGPAGD